MVRFSPSQVCALTALTQEGTWAPETYLDPSQVGPFCPHAHTFNLGGASDVAPHSGSKQ